MKNYEYFKMFFCVIYEGINKHEEIINKKNLFNKKKKINIKGDKNKCKNIDIFFKPLLSSLKLYTLSN